MRESKISKKKQQSPDCKRCSVKKASLEISQNSQENSCAKVSFLVKLQAEASQVFSCEFCEISKNTFC